ncbi:lanthionine synthetase LanC family protein [Taibaiella koreensis]|uniref:lanthionine synthetase LanC family protein n=1 Tax=Taibaiella koreensis TaxID=1268548 RepID=UPI0013C2C08A|nr:lanthionine synthetase LanC family protein [Taibaiella koreensis]
MDMQQVIAAKLKQLFDVQAPSTSAYQTGGMLSGGMGMYLYQFLYTTWQGIEFEAVLPFEALVEEEFSNKSMSMCGGHAGLNWLYHFLVKKDIIDQETGEAICFEDAALKAYALAQLKSLDWDMLHGALGIAYCLLYWDGAEEAYFRKIFEGLAGIRKGDRFPQYDSEKDAIVYDLFNPGLAHGLASLLKFCLQCCKQGMCTDVAAPLARELTGLIVGRANKDTSINYFPGLLPEEGEQDTYSRLAWCYGDLGIGYILYQAGIYFNDGQTTSFALEVLRKTANRRTVEQTQVMDAGFCHGSSGVAYIYNKLWHYTGEPVFKEATDFWIQKTLRFATYEDGPAGYKMYHAPTDSYEAGYNLIEGIAGVALVLLSYVTGDFSWDYCLMLND